MRWGIRERRPEEAQVSAPEPAREASPRSGDFEIRRIRDDGELRQAVALRHEVFCVEQGVPEREELDGRDHQGLHLVALMDGEIVATCRIVMVGSVAQFSRLAVRRDARRRGIATALLEAADAETRAAGGQRLVLHAQTYARKLYENAGYRPHGA